MATRRGSRATNRSNKSNKLDGSSGGYVKRISNSRSTWQGLALIFLVAGLVGALGAFNVGKSHAWSKGYFYAGDKAYPKANRNSSYFVGYFKAGYHNIDAVANCSGIIGGSTGHNGNYNYWWVHSPTIDGPGGWINQVFAAGGGNNQNSFPWLPNWGKGSCIPN